MPLSWSPKVCCGSLSFSVATKSQRHTVVCASLAHLTPSCATELSVVCDKAFCCVQQSFLSWPALSRHKILYRDTKPLHHCQLCHDIKTFCRNKKTPGLAKLCHDIKPFCCDKKSPFPGRLGHDLKHSITTPLYEILS